MAEGKVIAGPLVRAACARHLRDLEAAQDRGLEWRPASAERAYGYFRDVLRLNGGEHEGLPFELQPSQQFIVGSLFGWHTEDGFRRFRVAYIEQGKGNGKSPLAAGVGCYMLTADGEPRAEVYAAATKKDQAMILFRDAVAMVDQSPALKKRITKYGGLNPWNLIHEPSQSFFRAIASDDSQSGPRPHCALIDEVHEHPDGKVIDMMRAGTKGRRQALIFEITNSGFDRTSLCYQHHEYTQRIVEGVVDDDSWFGFVCGLDEGDDWRDELVWLKANPLLGVSITHKYLREQVREAIGMPAKQSVVRRLNFCEWVDAESPWIDGDMWRACVADLKLDDYRGRPCYGGLDLSGKNDLTALVLDFPRDDGGHDLVGLFWAPADTLRAHEDRDRAPYTTWRDQGFLRTTPGRSIDFAFPAQQVKELMGLVDLKAVAFDRWRIDDFARELDELGVSTEQIDIGGEPKGSGDLVLMKHGQGFKDMSPAVEAMETGILNGTLRIAHNPVMNMCSANAVMITDPSGNRKFDKRPGQSMGRIDGVVAAAMAHKCATATTPAGTSFWE